MSGLSAQPMRLPGAEGGRCRALYYQGPPSSPARGQRCEFEWNGTQGSKRRQRRQGKAGFIVSGMSETRDELNPGSDDRPVAGQVRRHAHFGLEAGRLAARYVGRRAAGSRDGSGASDLVRALGNLKGPVMKVGQLLAAVPDLLPPEYAQELSALQADAPPMGWLFVRRRMASELGPDWQDRFDEFGRAAAHAASLGQVHRARAGGRELAVKLQYPAMASTVQADLRQLRLLLGLYGRYDRAIHTEEIYAELATRLQEELDYTRERRHQRLFGAILAKTDGVRTPVPVDDLCTDRLLSMTWLDGRPLRELADAPQELRDQAALHLFRAWYEPFYRYGVIHGDPHPGNYSLADDGALNLLDFGCVRTFRPEFVEGVINLYRAKRDQDEDLAVAAYESWGFTGLSRELRQVLDQWADYLYAPLLDDRARLIQDSTDQGRKVVVRVHRELRRLGGVRPPQEFVLVDRAAIGLGSVFTTLKAQLNWHRQIETIMDGFSAEKLARNQEQALQRAGLATGNQAD